MDLSALTVSTVVAFLLVLFRISGMLMTAPLLNIRSIPPQVKIGMAFTLSVLLFPFHTQHLVVPTDLIQFALLAAQEVIIGLLLGFAANLVFVGIQMAGEFISYQMGMSMSSMLDPMSGSQIPTLGQVYFYFALLIFLALNAHHVLILGVNHSFEAMPLGSFISQYGVMAERFIMLTAGMFTVALLVSIPVMGVMLVTEIALGFMAKVMPQMNIFMVGLPLKVGVGLLALMVSLPFVSDLLEERYDLLFQQIEGLFSM